MPHIRWPFARRYRKRRVLLGHQPTTLYFRRHPGPFRTKSERILLDQLHADYGDRFHINGPSRLAELVGLDEAQLATLPPKERRDQRDKDLDSITRQHVDFVLSSKASGHTALAIELDGTSHDNARQAHLDGLKDLILEAAGIPFLRLPVGYDWGEVKRQIDAKLSARPSHPNPR